MNKKNIITLGDYLFCVITSSLAGYGMFWWYMQPWGLKIPFGFSLMFSFLTTAFISLVLYVWRPKKGE